MQMAKSGQVVFNVHVALLVLPDGKPIGGASVMLRVKPRFTTHTGVSNPRDVLAKKTTGADGRFAFEKIAIPLDQSWGISSLLRHEGGAELIVLADGCGIVWADTQELNPKESVRLTLEPEARVSGTVCDKSGTALAGVRLAVYGLTRSATTVAMFYQPGDLNVGASEVRLNALTDSEGRFVLHHLPLDYRRRSQNSTLDRVLVSFTQSSKLYPITRLVRYFGKTWISAFARQ